MSAGSAERGYTLAGALIILAVLGGGLAAYGELASHAAQRQKEEELLFIGNQVRQAIGGYYEASPGVKRFPHRLEDLLEDKRYPMPQRYLRRMYKDPMTGQAQWGTIPSQDGGIMGVYSLSESAPIKTGNFAARDATLEGTGRYADWHFSYVPLPVLQ